VIVMGVPQQDLDTSFAGYRRAVEMAEAVRQRAVAAALADHRRVLGNIEAAYRRDLAAARCRWQWHQAVPACATGTDSWT
jgi:hypothetical protein